MCSRDKISESLMRIFSGISAAIFALMSKLSRSCPPTSCLPTTPDPLTSQSARTADFPSWISWDPLCLISLKARPRARERRVGCKKVGNSVSFPSLLIEGNAYDAAEHREDELNGKERTRRGGVHQNGPDGLVETARLFLLGR